MRFKLVRAASKTAALRSSTSVVENTMLNEVSTVVTTTPKIRIAIRISIKVKPVVPDAVDRLGVLLYMFLYISCFSRNGF